jgi:hypothetical protein
MKEFKNYNRQELFNIIEKISIEKNSENIVITKFAGRVLNTTQVSNRYEIFDIVKYLKEKINSIEENFPISKYLLEVKGGKQTLQLISDAVEIGGVEFYKSFFILNSTDRSRRLSFNAGLRSESKNFYLVGVNNISLTKKHLKGVTIAAEDASSGLNGETFNEQIMSIKSILGHKIKFSKLRDIILGLDVLDFKDVANVNHKKFDAFKNIIRWSSYTPSKDGGVVLNNEQKNMIFTTSEKMTDVSPNLDFYLDAFWVLQVYLRIFNKQDANVVRNETERIMKMTQWSVRNSILESLGI